MKTFISNFCQKQLKKWIGGPMACFTLWNFYCFPNLTPQSVLSSPYTFRVLSFLLFFTEFWKTDIKNHGRGPSIELFIAFLTWSNLTNSSRPLSSFFHNLTPLVWWSLKFSKESFSKERLIPVLMSS